MGLEVVSIQFNHNAASATNDALTIRRNATNTVALPEWQAGVSVNPSDSPAAYAIGAVGKNTITIKARFRITPLRPLFPPKVPVVMIQAITAPRVVNPLGNVAPTPVKF